MVAVVWDMVTVLGAVLLSRIVWSGLWRCKILKYDVEVVHFSKIRNIGYFFLLDDPIAAWKRVQLDPLKLASESTASSLPLSIYAVMKFRWFSSLKFLHRLPYPPCTASLCILWNLLLSVYFDLWCFSWLHICKTKEKQHLLC